MVNDRTQILNMLKDGKISVSEAEELLAVVEKPADDSGEQRQDNTPIASKKPPKYLRVMVDSQDGHHGKDEKINIRIPLQLLRAGVKVASVVPDKTQGKINDALRNRGLNIDLQNLKAGQLDTLIESLTEVSIDVDSDNEKVRIFCE